MAEEIDFKTYGDGEGKLVRDDVLADLDRRGIRYGSRKVTKPADRLRELLKKLVEEAQEARGVTMSLDIKDPGYIQSLLEELGDLRSVEDAIRSEIGISEDELKRVQEEKDKKRGLFNKGDILTSTWREK